MSAPGSAPKGRGSALNPPNRFEPVLYERDPDWNPEDEPGPATRFFRDLSQTIISYNDSPDLPFGATLNPYRGCEHGCCYCYARPTHEYLGFSSGLDFETNIIVKERAAELLRKELSSRRWEPQTLALSGASDCYQPIERKLQLTRRCLEVLLEFRNPVSIVTKNRLVTRDIDLLKELANYRAVSVSLSVNSLDPEFSRKLEPRTSSPSGRLGAIAELARAGIPVGVMVAPTIPGLNDSQIPRVLEAAATAGAQWAGIELLRLPFSVTTLFEDWLERNEPLRKEKVLSQIREMRGGKLNDSRFGYRMRGEGTRAEQIAGLFEVASRKFGLSGGSSGLSTSAFRRPAGSQLEFGFPGSS